MNTLARQVIRLCEVQAYNLQFKTEQDKNTFVQHHLTDTPERHVEIEHTQHPLTARVRYYGTDASYGATLSSHLSQYQGSIVKDTGTPGQTTTRPPGPPVSQTTTRTMSPRTPSRVPMRTNSPTRGFFG